MIPNSRVVRTTRVGELSPPLTKPVPGISHLPLVEGQFSSFADLIDPLPRDPEGADVLTRSWQYPGDSDLDERSVPSRPQLFRAWMSATAYGESPKTFPHLQSI